jgi:signal peptidase I
MRRFVRIATRLLVAAALLISVGLIIVPGLLGYQRYVIVGGSMTGTISKGSVVYARKVPVEQLKVGDIITFVPPGMSEPVTHRIIGIGQGQDGQRTYETKGDFNEVKDPWQMNLAGPVQARYAFHIPAIGYVLAALSIRKVRMLLIGLPAFVIALSLLWSLWKQAGEDVKRQEAGELAAVKQPARDNLS